MQPYHPKYAYKYSCELEVVGRMNMDGTHYARTEFVIDGSGQPQQFSWAHMLYTPGHVMEKLDSPLPFSVEGHRVDLYFRPGAEGNDRVTLRLTLEQVLGGKYSVQYAEEEHFTREDVSLSAKVSMTARRLDDGKHENQSGYLNCVKEK